MLYKKALACGILAVIVGVAAWQGYSFMAADICANQGNIWDKNENKCREDCIYWSPINGCIKMTEEQVKLIKECKGKGVDCVPMAVYGQICIQNNLPINKVTGECETEFTPEDCWKLGENWAYPQVCTNDMNAK